MKYTLLITQECNLACPYCYIGKRKARMALPTAEKILAFAYTNTPAEEKVDLGFFGGEPLLEFGLVKDIASRIRQHASFDNDRVEVNLVTNGTLFTEEIAAFLVENNIGLTVSCDGPPEVQDRGRRYRDGTGTSARVEETIRLAIDTVPHVNVNAVYGPESLAMLPATVDYFASLGVRHIYLNPDYSARWSKSHEQVLPKIYSAIAKRYMDDHRRGEPRFVSLLDSKIAVILRGGYRAPERCRMGRGEYAFTPEGSIYPCERLVGSGNGDGHRIGHIDSGIDLGTLSCHMTAGDSVNPECLDCGIRDYCMNWCGCSNYFASGSYNRVGSFICASETESVRAAFAVLETLEKELGPTFYDHLSGDCLLWSSSRNRGKGEC